ncbi:MAG: translation initiation factor IF-3 [Alphaproteobacteria bacterium]
MASYPGRGPQNPEKDGPRVNESIRVPKVRLIDHKGDNIGVISRDDALKMARQAGLDLIEVSPNVDPPVCKISDFGKYKYELQKKKSEMRRKQKTIEIKEVKIRPMIEENDYQVKLRNVKRFIGDGNKVKVSLRFRGREMTHQELGMKVMNRIIDDMEELAKVDNRPKLEGRQVIMVLSPR